MYSRFAGLVMASSFCQRPFKPTMKYIATQGFVQGRENPLNLPDSPMHVATGMIVDLTDEQINHPHVEMFIRHKQLVVYESDDGKRVQTERKNLAAREKEENRAKTLPMRIALWGLALTLIGILVAVLIHLSSFFASHR